MRTLFENEKVITEANNKSVVLTNKRIWKEDSGSGKSFYQSIMLPQISSVQCITEEFVVFLFAGILLILAAFYIYFKNEVQVAFLTIVGGGLLILFYFLSKSTTVIIASSSAKLKLSIKGMKKEKVIQFLDQIESAIDAYSK